WTLIRSPVETRCAGVAAMFAKLQLYPNADSQPAKPHRAALLRAAAIQCGLNHSVTHRFTHLSFTWRGDGRLFVERAFARHRGDDLPAVKTPILDKNFAGLHSADHDTGDIDSGHITFETFRIRLRLPGYRIEANSLPLEKFEVRMIAGHRENLNGGQGLLVRVRPHPHFVRLDARNFRIEHCGDLAGADAVLDVGLHPIFQTLAQRRIAMH